MGTPGRHDGVHTVEPFAPGMGCAPSMYGVYRGPFGGQFDEKQRRVDKLLGNVIHQLGRQACVGRQSLLMERQQQTLGVHGVGHD